MDREITGHLYTSSKDDARELFKVETDYVNGKFYLTGPDEEAKPEVFIEYGRAIIRAARDWKKFQPVEKL
jgi:hypothetical protein